MFFSSGDYGGNKSHPVTVSYKRDNRRDSHLNLRVMAAACHMSVANEEGPNQAGPPFPCQYDKLTPKLALQRKRQEQYFTFRETRRVMLLHQEPATRIPPTGSESHLDPVMRFLHLRIGLFRLGELSAFHLSPQVHPKDGYH